MNKKEINAIKCLKVDMLDNEQIKIILNLIDKQQKEIEELKSQLDFIADQNNYISRLEKEIKLMKSININDNYISKDKVLDILGYEEDDEQRKNMTTEKILSLIETIFEECDRLEDIEDKKIQVEIQNIENRRDKEWEDKIKKILKKYEKTNVEDYQKIIRFYKDLEKLLKEE